MVFSDIMPALQRGETYLIEVVLRTLTLGHHFTQGTADSNEVWLEVEAASGEEVLVGHSGQRRPSDNGVDPWAHFVNAFVIDRHGTCPGGAFPRGRKNRSPPGSGVIG